MPNEAVETSEDVSALRLLIERLENENKELKEQLDSFKMQATESVSEIALLQQQNTELTERLHLALNIEVKDTETSELNVQITQLKQEIKDLTEQRDQAVVSEAQTSASLESLREELSRLGAVTMELMKEVEQSQGVEKEKSIEIESLKKLCQVRRVSEVEADPNEVMKLKDMLAGLLVMNITFKYEMGRRNCMTSWELRYNRFFSRC